MKNILIVFFVIVIAFTSNVFSQFGQPHCGSQLDFEEMQRTDSARYRRFMDYEHLLQTQLLNSRSIPSGVITIPVVVHIVYNTNAPQENISSTQIDAQIQVLNEDFRRLNADAVKTPLGFRYVAADTEFEFKLATVDPNGNATTGITRTATSVNGFSQNNDVKFTSSGGHDTWDAQRYLNIWVCNLIDPVYPLTNILGYSTFPQDLATNPNLDGVVIKYTCFGVGGHTLSPYNKGRSTTHEVGHWLDLRHLWGDPPFVYNISCAYDDGVADTPPQYEPTYGCSVYPKKDPCTQMIYTGIMFMNYMDYTDDACKNLFTQGQKNRMRALFDDQNGLRRNMLGHCLTGPFWVNFANETVTSDSTVKSCGNIDVEDVSVTNNAKLKLEAPGKVTINHNFSVPVGSTLEIK